MTEAPIDLITNILSWLPAKSLLRFKCVSKTWHNLISDPGFIELHRERSKQNLKFLHVSVSDNDDSCMFNIISTDTEGRVLQNFSQRRYHSCEFVVRETIYNDLMCFRAFPRYGYCTMDLCYVCNPSTGELLTLPKGSPSVGPPLLSDIRVGLGYLSSSKEFKVVRLFFTRLDSTIDDKYEVGNYEIGCEIFSFSARRQSGRDSPKPSSSTWRIIDDKCPYPLDNRLNCVNECLYSLDDERLRGAGDVIVCFDLKDEKFRTIPLPPIPKGSGIALVASKVKLSVAENVNEEIIKIWMHKDDDNCIWSKAYSIDLNLIGINKEPGFNSVPRCMVNGELVFIPHAEDRIYYNLERQDFRWVKVPKLEGNLLGLSWQSIVPL